MESTYYTFYNRKTDEIICQGTASELVAAGHFKDEKTVRNTASSAHTGKIRKREVLIEPRNKIVPEEVKPLGYVVRKKRPITRLTVFLCYKYRAEGWSLRAIADLLDRPAEEIAEALRQTITPEERWHIATNLCPKRKRRSYSSTEATDG